MEKRIKKLHEEVFDGLKDEIEIIKNLPPMEREMWFIRRSVKLHTELIHGLTHALLYKGLLNQKDLDKGIKIFRKRSKETGEYVNKLRKR